MPELEPDTPEPDEQEDAALELTRTMYLMARWRKYGELD